MIQLEGVEKVYRTDRIETVALTNINLNVRAGEFIWRADPMPLSIPTLVTAFGEDPWAFLQRFGLTGVHAATAWLLSTPLIIASLYFSLRPALRRFAKK